MAGDVSVLGDLVVDIGADLSDLEPQLGKAVDECDQAGQQIAAALNGIDFGGGLIDSLNQADQQLNLFADDVQKVAENLDAVQMPLFDTQSIEAADAAFGSLDQNLPNMRAHLEEVAGAAEDVKQPVQELANETENLGERLVAAGEALVIFETLKEIGGEAIEAADGLQRFNISMTAMSGSAEAAETALQGIEAIAKTQPFAMPDLLQAGQRMQAFGVETEKIPSVLQAAANAAAATGNSFEGVASAMARIQVSGQVTARQLVQLGVSWQDLAKTMGVSMDEAQAALKRGGQDAAADLQAVIDTVNAKFSGMGQKMAQTFEGQWDVLKNQMHEVFADLGTAITPALSEIVDMLQTTVIPAVRETVEAFGALPAPLRDFITLSAGAGIALTGLSAAAKALGIDLAATNISATALLATLERLSYIALVGAFVQLQNSIQGYLAALNNVDQSQQDMIKGLDKATAYLNAHGIVVDRDAQSLEVWRRNVQEGFAQLGQAGPTIEAHNSAMDRLNKTYEAQKQALADAQKNLQLVKTAYDQGKASAGQLADAQAQVKKAMEDLNGPVVKNTEALKKQKEIQDALQQEMDDWARSVHDATEAANRLAEQITAIAQKDKDAVSQITGDAAAWIDAMAKRADAVEDLDKKTVAAFKEMVQSEKDLITSNDALKKSFDDTHDQMQADATDEIDITVQLRDRVGEVTASYTQMAAEMHRGGMQTVQDLDAEIASAQRLLDSMQRFNQPLAEQAQQMTVLNNLLMQRAALTDLTGQSELIVAQRLADSERKTQAVNDATMLLANTYLNMKDSFAKAWDQLDKGIADAIVSGQNFGQVFTKIFNDLKKELMEQVVHVLMTEVKEAILQNTELLHGFNTVFNALFNAGGVVPQGLEASQKMIADAAKKMADTAQQAADQVDKLAKTTTQGVQQVGAAATSALSSIFSMVTGALTAIASIIQTFQLAHMITILERIELSTRKTWIVVGEQSDSIFQSAKESMLKLGDVVNYLAQIWPTTFNSEQLLEGISGILTQIATDMHFLVSNGITVAGGGSGGSVGGDIWDAIARQAGMLDQLGKQINDINRILGGGGAAGAGGGGGGTYDVGSFADAVTNFSSATTDFAQATSGLGTVTAAAADVVSSTVSQSSVQALVASASSYIDQIATGLPNVIGNNGGVGSTNAAGALIGAPSGGYSPYVGSGPVIHVTVQAGVVAGSNGMEQLGNMVGDKIVSKLRQVAGLKI